MDNSEEDEVFEIVDFTTASEWEVFTSHVEELLQDWNICGELPALPVIPPNKLGSSKWKDISHVINYHDFPFKLTYYEVIPNQTETPEENIPEPSSYDDDEDLPNSLWASIHDSQNSFPSKVHCIARWYGLRQFILVSPSSTTVSVTQCKARLILSALTIACSNSNCHIPVFVQVLRPADRIFLGTLTANGIRADFDMIHLKQSAPHDCYDLIGLVRMLSDKLSISETKLFPLTSARCTYIISDWPEETCWSQAPPDMSLCLGTSDVEVGTLGELPFGLLCDPIREFHISAIWQKFINFKDDGTSFSLDPCKAEQWTAKVLPSNDSRQNTGLLSEHLSEFISMCTNSGTLTEILGTDFMKAASQPSADFSSAFDRLTEHRVPSLGSVIMAQKQRRDARKNSNSPSGPLPSDVLVPMLTFLFPEEEDEMGSPYPTSWGRVPPTYSGEEGLPEEHILKDVSASIKSCPADSLSWRLSVLCCHVLHSFGGVRAVAHLIYEVMQELRFRWDNCESIPGVSSSETPDLGSCLLHQKLQMLNCCINHRRNRERVSNEVNSVETTEETDEFYDCMSDEYEENEEQSKLPEWDKPEGRLRACDKLMLLKVPSRRLYVPITQDPAPVTEDRLEEQAEVLLHLGDSDEGSAMRAKFMSSSLMSDMESFKAANPGCVLGDFVRWYSPRDWVEVNEGEAPSGVEIYDHHTLSERMTVPGNLWQEIWQTSHPVPARRQKRLFDDTKQAEAVLQWFESLTPGAFCRHLLSTLMHAACCTVAHQPALYCVAASATGSPDLPILQHQSDLSAVLVVLTQRVGRLSRQPPDITRYLEVVEQLVTIENCLGRAMSLRHKLLSENTTESDRRVLLSLISELVSSSEVPVEGAAKGVAGHAILRLFKRAMMNEDPLLFSNSDRSSENVSSKPHAETVRSKLGYVAAREYIIRIKAEYPTKTSRLLPHRIYATLMPGDFRVAGLFCKDTMFT